MHACIAALSQGIPCVGIAYSRKFRGVFETVGLPDMALDARELPEKDMLEGCLGRFGDREIAAGILRRTVPQVRADLEACFRAMMCAAAEPAQHQGRSETED
jgi:polysaccharide pyruvyl transferase WcaK-like protein